jgi:hypothetical protein
MDDLVLELLIDQDTVAGASFIVEKLSTSPISGNEMSKTRRQSLSRQSSSSVDQHSRPIPLSERMLCNKRRIDNGASPTHQSWSQSKLLNALNENKYLVERCMQCISSRISNDTRMCVGQVALLFRAFSVLVHCTGICDPKAINQILGRIPDLLKMVDTSSELPECSPVDDVYKLAICLIILVWLKIDRTEKANSDMATSKTLSVFLLRMMSSPSSIECHVFSSRLGGFVVGNEATNLMTMILQHVYSTKSLANVTFEIKPAVSMINLMLSDREKLEQICKSALTLSTTVYNPIVAVEAIRRCESAHCTDFNNLVKNLLSDQQSCQIILHNPMMCELVQESVNMLMRSPSPQIPLVLPVSLNGLSTRAMYETVTQFHVW